jgi:bifunctional DNase/RNase
MMIPMFVTGVGMEERTGLPVVLLNDEPKRRALPILVALPEAKAITRALQNTPSTRPNTHELLFEVVSAFGYELDHVSIDHALNDTYLAKMALVPVNNEDSDLVVELDARPSDAIVLALMQDAPIMVSEQVLQAGGIELKVIDGDKITEDKKDALELQSFKDFVREVKASDFNKFGHGPIQLPE